MNPIVNDVMFVVSAVIGAGLGFGLGWVVERLRQHNRTS